MAYADFPRKKLSTLSREISWSNNVLILMGAKSEEAVKEATELSKKLFVFVAKCEADLLKGTFSLATFIPKHILSGIADKSETVYRGKQSIKRLVGSGAKLEDIPIKAESTKDFESIARQYGIDYSLKMVKHGDKTQCFVFFKAKDIDVLTAAFNEYSAKMVERENKKQIKERIKEKRTAAKTQKRELKREKKKDRGIDL